MALIEEDGTGKANAESYSSVADADAYHSARGNAAWASLSSDVKEQCLRRATDYMVQNYRASWKGLRTSANQALDWPRYGVRSDTRIAVLSTIVPPEVKRACAELALRASTGELNPDLTRGVLKEAVGPIVTEYDPASPQQKRFRSVDLMLRPLLTVSGANAEVGRR